MADVVIDANVTPQSEGGQGGGGTRLLVDVSSSVLYSVYRNASNAIVYRKSTDGGQTWGSAVTVAAATVNSPSVWFDRWTSGDTGTKIWISWLSGTQVLVRSLDTSGDTLGTAVSVGATITAVTIDSCTQIVKDRGGYLFVAYSANSGLEEGFYRSIDSGANWTSRNHPFEAAAIDPFQTKLLPANLADNHDLWMLYGDDSDNTWSLKTYDDSANSWSEQAISLTSSINNVARQCDAAIRHSDGHMIAVICSHVDSALGDLAVFDIDGAGSITQKTNIITDKDDWAAPVVYINQNNNELFVGWLGNPDGSDTWTATVKPWISRSTDGGISWSTPTLYSEDVADDYRGLWTSHSTPGAADGRFSLAWFDDDDNDLFYGYTNSVAITASSGTSIVPPQGNFALSSAAPTVARTDNRNIAPSQGNVALSSAAPTVSVSNHRDVSPAGGNVALSSAAPSVVQDVARSPARADLALSGTAPTVARTDHRNISPAGGNFALSTAAPATSIDHRPAVAQGNVALSSTAPTVARTDNRNITPDAAQPALSSSAPTVARTDHRNISPTAGQLAVSSAAPTVSAGAGVSIVPAGADLALSGSAPAVVQDIRPAAAAGNLVLSGTAPTAVRTDHRNISPAAAQLVVTSAAPGVQAGGSTSIIPGQRDLVLSSSAPTVAVTNHRTISPAAGQLVQTGAAPTVFVADAKAFSPAAAQIVLITQAPTVGATTNIFLYPSGAELFVAGFAPTVVGGIAVLPRSVRTSRGVRTVYSSRAANVSSGRRPVFTSKRAANS